MKYLFLISQNRKVNKIKHIKKNIHNNDRNKRRTKQSTTKVSMELKQEWKIYKWKLLFRRIEGKCSIYMCVGVLMLWWENRERKFNYYIHFFIRNVLKFSKRGFSTFLLIFFLDFLFNIQRLKYEIVVVFKIIPAFDLYTGVFSNRGKYNRIMIFPFVALRRKTIENCVRVLVYTSSIDDKKGLG